MRFLRRLCRANRVSLRPAERRLFDRCRTATRCFLIAGTAPTLSIDPASTGGKEWEDFLRAYNDFCSARGGEPLFNQTPFLTSEQAQKAFGGRQKLFADYRRQADPDNRLLDSYFRDFLS